MKLNCYCCGELIEGNVALVRMGDGTPGRVFVMIPEHVERVDDADVIQSETVIRERKK